MKHSNFDHVAPFYDSLAALLFGSKLINAQTIFLNVLKENDQVLILGGGTGLILEELNKLNIPLKISYVDSSTKMINLSKARTGLANLQIDFINQPFQDVIFTQDFDVICTFFFLDLFTEKTLKRIVNKIGKLVHQDSTWLHADFFLHDGSPRKHRLLIKLLFLFFHTFANLQSNQLLDYKKYIVACGFTETKAYEQGNGLIQSAVFSKH